MSLLKFFFGPNKSAGFAKTVVEEYCRVDALVDSGKKHAGRKPERMIAIIRRISGFARTEKLGVYGRAKLLAAIKSGLIGAGIPVAETEEFIEAVTLEELRPTH